METTEFCMAIAEQAINFVNDSCTFEGKTEEESKKLRDKAIASTAALFLYREVEKLYLEEYANLVEMTKMFVDQVEDVNNPVGLPYTFCDMISGKTKEALPGIIEKYNNFMDFVEGKNSLLKKSLKKLSLMTTELFARRLYV